MQSIRSYRRMFTLCCTNGVGFRQRIRAFIPSKSPAIVCSVFIYTLRACINTLCARESFFLRVKYDRRPCTGTNRISRPGLWRRYPYTQQLHRPSLYRQLLLIVGGDETSDDIIPAIRFYTGRTGTCPPALV